MYLRVSLTDRCNLRCRYCLDEQVTFARERCSTGEILRLTELVHEVAQVHKIRLTGGEPTLCDDLLTHVEHAASLVPTVGLTSNGVLLEPLLEPLQQAGLNRLNISIDAVDAAGFTAISRRTGVDRVISAIRRARDLGFTPLKINAVALPEVDAPALAAFAIETGVHLRFIELMAIGPANEQHADNLVTANTLQHSLWQAGHSLQECTERDDPTARVWTIDHIDPDHSTIGFITTMSDPFCATCDRLRLSSQGRLHTCLFDERGHDLISDLRRGDETAVRRTIAQAVASKAPPPHFQRNASMANIGG